MKMNKSQIIIIVIFSLLLALIAVPNLLIGGPHDSGFLPIYPIIVGAGAIGVYLTRNKRKSN
jgi:hypothetical protein